MDTVYVAFGQLIDGEKTLKEIENVHTSYEAPTKSICIVQAGVLVGECRDIAINRGTLEYINGHIEDLVSLRDALMEVRAFHLDMFISNKVMRFGVENILVKFGW